MRVRRNATTSTLRLVAAVLLAAVVAAGCGGSDDDTDAAESDSSTDTSATEPDEADAGEGEGESESGSGNDAAAVTDAPAAGTATVTIGDATFVADQQVVCVQIGDAIGGSWNDGADIAISIDLPPQDWETSPDGWTAPSVRVDDDRDQAAVAQFQANPEMAAMLSVGEDASMVTSWAVDGSSASGTGVFVEFFGSMAAISTGEDPPAPVEGTFSLTCE